jgi:hypothetical protein
MYCQEEYIEILSYARQIDVLARRRRRSTILLVRKGMVESCSIPTRLLTRFFQEILS